MRVKEDFFHADFSGSDFSGWSGRRRIMSMVPSVPDHRYALTGILLGPYVLNLLDPSILAISAELRQMALIIILLKAGLSLNLSDLRKMGRPAILMSFVPASFEILAFFLLGPRFLGITPQEAALMGAVLAILITAPLGALGIDLTYRRLLRRSSAETADVV